MQRHLKILSEKFLIFDMEFFQIILSEILMIPITISTKYYLNDKYLAHRIL